MNSPITPAQLKGLREALYQCNVCQSAIDLAQAAKVDCDKECVELAFVREAIQAIVDTYGQTKPEMKESK